ncbi:hypothetical protein [Grimontia sp. NTOU-MAR1]|uniref:hypothetical protein n=1 Tax=Grimontia sp. NTOU-MAR1 TaxID=3111011 RepID=UPI002DB98D7F|nr:hypothetical protein [Grimontia sp. NTOU-MAR1]WRV97606.1 hypothetical protein VP504_16450 [Grimontia sp. NTOU-MAR1]
MEKLKQQNFQAYKKRLSLGKAFFYINMLMNHHRAISEQCNSLIFSAQNIWNNFSLLVAIDDPRYKKINL